MRFSEVTVLAGKEVWYDGRVTGCATWYNIDVTNQGGRMTKYQVHYEKYTPKGIKRGIRTVKARNEEEAKIRVASVVEGSFAHWVNRLANEVA